MTNGKLKKLDHGLGASTNSLRAYAGLKAIDYVVPVLGLIFLRYANNKYSQYEAEIVKEYKADKEPTEEYELVTYWAKDLRLHNNFELLNENKYRNKRTDIDNLLASIAKDSYDLDSNSPSKDQAMDKFQKTKEEIGLNIAVVLLMQAALNNFEGMPPEKIKEIAIQIAMTSTEGFNPRQTIIWI